MNPLATLNYKKDCIMRPVAPNMRLDVVFIQEDEEYNRGSVELASKKSTDTETRYMISEIEKLVFYGQSHN